MSIYMNRLLPKSNSSFLLTTGTALKSQVLCLREDTFVLDTGLSKPRICMQDELTSIPQNPSTTRFSTRVEFLKPIASESLIKKKILERFFVDLVAGDSDTKERAAAKFKDLVGSTDAVPGELMVNLPRKFRQKLAWNELHKASLRNKFVRGFILDKVRGGYSVGIAGFIAFLPFSQKAIRMNRKNLTDMYVIERVNEKKSNIVVK